jgi:hypothetical protein
MQLDLFESKPEPRFVSDVPPPYQPNLDDVRARLNRILAEARAAKSIPWDADKTLVYQTIFPHMTGWLPEEEGAQLRFAFEQEMARLKAA